MLAPFGAPDRTSIFDVDPERLTIQTVADKVVDDRVDPRTSDPAFDLGTTKWDPIQFAYFASTANWNWRGRARD